MWLRFKHNLLQVAIAFDQLIFCLLGLIFFYKSWSDMTISADLFRNKDLNIFLKVCYNIVNGIFFWQENHCKTSYESEIERMHIKEDMR